MTDSEMMPSTGDNGAPQVRVMQIICGALIMGVLMFAMVACVIRFGNPNQKPANEPFIAYLAAGMAAMILVARTVVLPMAQATAIKQIVAARGSQLTKLDFYPVYQTRLIISSALLEGAAFFNLISFILEGQPWSLAVAGLMVIIMASGFPTLDRVDAWADDQLRTV